MEPCGDHVTDSDLDDLLDDALADFGKPPSAPNNTPLSKAFNKKQKVPSSSTDVGSSQRDFIHPNDLFGQFFDAETSKHLEEEWKNALNELKSEDPELAENLQSGQPPPTATAEGNPGNLNERVKSTFEALNNDVKKTTSNNNGWTPEDGMAGIPEEFANLGMGSDEQSIDIMENLMGMLLSKNMMYEPMKDLCQKFVPWIESKKGVLSEAEIEDYNNQLRCLKEICAELEKEKDDDSKEIKQERSQRVMTMVDELQKYGDPPTELTGDSLPGDLPKDACCIS